MKKSISVILVTIMALLALGNVSAQPEIMQGTTEDIRTASPTSTNNPFYLGSDFHAIIYGDSKVKCNGREYRFADQQLVCETNGKTECILSADGDNLNISNGKLYYSVYESGIASVVSFDLTSGKERELFRLGNDRIANMYVINDSMLELLAGNQVVRYNINTESIDILDAPKESFSFIPTEYGNLYATGSSVDSTIVFMGKVLVRHATYYSVENGAFIATVDGNTYQMPITEITDRCSRKEDQTNVTEICQLADMEEYNYYGLYNVSDVIVLNEEDCEVCSIAAETSNQEKTLFETSTRSVTGIQITPNQRQQTIINRASSVVNLEWTPESSFMSYKSTVPDNGECDFISGETYIGLPYMLPSRIFSVGYTPVYIGFGTFWDTGTATTLTAFQSRVTEHNDFFNKFARTTYGQHGYGPLYGQDCSRFVSYAWGYSTANSTLSYDSDDKCEKMTNVPVNGCLSATDLALLLPGDAFVSYNNHAILVTAVYKNSSGSAVTRVETMEETPPKAVKRIYDGNNGINNLLSKLANANPQHPYQIYRLKESVRFITYIGSVTPLSIPIVTGKTYGYCNSNSLPVPVMADYAFDGWYTSRIGGTLVAASTQVTNTSARKLYAQWHYVPVRSSTSIIHNEYR